MKNNFNQQLIVCILVQEHVNDRSMINISAIAPLIFASNILCLSYDGESFSMIFSKGLIHSFYPMFNNSIHFKDLFDQIEIYEKISLPNDFIILEDNSNEIILFHFDKFLCLTDINQTSFITENQWKIIIQYAKVNNRLDQLKYFVSMMKTHLNYSDSQMILKHFDLQYSNQMLYWLFLAALSDK